MEDKTFFDELFAYKVGKITKLENSELAKYSEDPNAHVYKTYDEISYLCELDDLTNTRILFRIFKCVNFMKNVLIAGLVCGGIGIVLSIMR